MSTPRGASNVELLVCGGDVVLSSGVQQDACVAISDGRISRIIPPTEPIPRAVRVIDARGKIVFPGVVDAHVHVETPGPPSKPFGVYSDSFEAMSRAAVSGGVTTVIPFVFASATNKPARYLRDFRRTSEKEAWVDFGFHFGIANRGDVEAIPDVVEMGVRSFKALMAYKQQGAMLGDALLGDAMREVGRVGGIMMVHAEDGELIDALEARAKADGLRSPPIYACCRPAAAENIAILRALELARGTGCVLYIVHLSTRQGLFSAKIARGCGQPVIIETCPHYLFLTDQELHPHRLGPFAKIGPPLRERSNCEALWEGVRDTQIDIIASDHAPRLREQKLLGLKDIFAAPFGSPGLETLLPVLYDEFRKRGLSIAALARLICATPARIFGMFPRKGAIAVGSDADLVIIDPDVRWTVKPEEFQTNAKYSLWAGRELQGKPVTTIVRGRVVCVDGNPSGGRGWGRFCPHECRAS
jgi:D-hydantoinase